MKGKRDRCNPGKILLSQTAAPAESAREGDLPWPLQPGPVPPSSLHLSQRPVLFLPPRFLVDSAWALGSGRCPRNLRTDRNDPAEAPRRRADAWLLRGRGVHLRSRRSRRGSWLFLRLGSGHPRRPSEPQPASSPALRGRPAPGDAGGGVGPGSRAPWIRVPPPAGYGAWP